MGDLSFASVPRDGYGREYELLPRFARVVVGLAYVGREGAALSRGDSTSSDRGRRLRSFLGDAIVTSIGVES